MHCATPERQWRNTRILLKMDQLKKKSDDHFDCIFVLTTPLPVCPRAYLVPLVACRVREKEKDVQLFLPWRPFSAASRKDQS